MVKYRKNVNVCAPLYAGLVKNAARPEGQDLNPCLFLVRTNFLEGGDVVVVVVMVVVGGVWTSLAFSLLRDFVYTANGPCKVSSARSK